MFCYCDKLYILTAAPFSTVPTFTAFSCRLCTWFLTPECKLLQAETYPAVVITVSRTAKHEAAMCTVIMCDGIFSSTYGLKIHMVSFFNSFANPQGIIHFRTPLLFFDLSETRLIRNH